MSPHKNSWTVLCETYPDLQLNPEELPQEEVLSSLASLPARDTLEINPGRGRTDFNLRRRNYNLKAVLAQISGEKQSDDDICTWCESGKGQWLGCVQVPGGTGSCANCLYGTNRCSLREDAAEDFEPETTTVAPKSAPTARVSKTSAATASTFTITPRKLVSTANDSTDPTIGLNGVPNLLHLKRMPPNKQEEVLQLCRDRIEQLQDYIDIAEGRF
ncbi:hypothetical protein PFICI_14557 [Pestalotiopsis fici W106-1]|uniref:Uncharacterized protein n=1 Tax=Pestalotiopsis fici (strain W106-1 / CGMCC3.15140) TaxID=1229662 RepID=W3WLC2_PESFW|nr:uncharacterized protein PFICI_14557 [Pestalotiopsis fici W106-1]ETS73611.1 hypothetical protein PFICI_14557 [Pestalotiopsis fici W106-1]